ncbi:endonuclease/exonuclease/phosphatase family protein [Marivirga sp. S37H4]|uniref:Endonuclease/exonuclease/phosphatase family protein n=1 Tax=Marivirga aurantiaca TaxID=2802615 RepID=A0A934X1A8_9BACT|nr:endonuclease/exonuclease/phosphatase family protein [Marivirga aurantiaca]
MPLIRHDHWTFRVFEFPRAQKWVLNLLIMLGYILLIGISYPIDFIFVGLLAVNLIYLSYQIYPFLPFSPKQIQSTGKNQKADIKLLISNVYQYNRKFEKLDQLIHENDADLVLMVETDKWWKEKSVESFGEKYPYQVLIDQENTYGMLIFSKFELQNTEVRHLVKKEVPSVVTEIVIKNKNKIKLFALHPEPPVPGENLYSTARDAEILMVGKEVANEILPVIVAGDLNDVAWSYTTTLFQRISRLLDPRRGRGFFSTFHAKYPLFRWPLDHVFCSGHFRVDKMKRLKGIGSDHFPILLDLYLSHIEDNSEQLEVDKDDRETAEEKIQAKE